MQDSIFTKIIKGEVPAHKVYEDETTIAFLDIHPDEEGHTLVVPKKQVDKMYDLDDETFTHLWLVAKRIAKHYEDTLSRRVVFHVVGVDVPHTHIHLVPYDPKNHSQHDAKMAEKMAKEPDHEALAAVAAKLVL